MGEAMNELKNILQEILGEEYINCEEFIETGLLDSLQVMELVDALEDEFGIEISGRDIVPENFQNFENIIALLTKYEVNL